MPQTGTQCHTPRAQSLLFGKVFVGKLGFGASRGLCQRLFHRRPLDQDVDGCFGKVREILAAERMRRTRQTGLIDFVRGLMRG